MALTPAGLTVPRLAEILASLKAAAQGEFGADVDTSPNGPLGHLLGLQAMAMDELYQLAQALYDAFNPDNAAGILLDNLCGLTGITREPATKAVVTLTLGGVPGTTVPVGKIVKALDSTPEDANFLTTTTVVIGVGGTVEVVAEAEVAGALVVDAAAAWEIVTPLGGWNTVANALAATPGTAAESDALLRRRREQSLQIIGAGPDAAIKAKLLALDAVESARVISNRTMATVDGIPPKAFHAVLWPDGLTAEQEDEAALVVWNNAPAGIESHGAEQFDITDDDGYTQRVRFSYATRVDIGMEADLTVEPNTYPADGDAQVAIALLAVFTGLSEEAALLNPALASVVGLGLGVGADVLVLRCMCALNTVPGVLSVVLRLDRKTVAFPPVGTVNIPIADTEIALLDAADLTVVQV